MPKKSLPVERLIELHEFLLRFPAYTKERRKEILKVANEYNLSEYTVRRQYNQWMNITLKGRSDKGSAKVASLKEIEQWVTMVAAVQLATLNKKGHMCSTRRAIEILEDGIMYENKRIWLSCGKKAKKYFADISWFAEKEATFCI